MDDERGNVTVELGVVDYDEGNGGEEFSLPLASFIEWMTPFEKAARALCVAVGLNPDAVPADRPPFQDPGKGTPCVVMPNWMWARPAVDAMIEAIRVPSDDMVEAGWEHTADPCWSRNVVEAWQAMIDTNFRT